jgi:hypothetical protein
MEKSLICEIEINQLKKSESILTFETGDYNHEPGANPIKTNHEK